MEWYHPILAAFLAGVLTYCDLDTVFDAPPSLSWGPWLKLLAAWWGFIIANAALAGLLYYALDESGYLKDLNPWLKAISVGAGYSALIRLKLTTLTINGKDTPVGVETAYEGLKGLVHKRINRVIREWRMKRAGELAQSDLNALREQSKLLVISDVLMSDAQRKEANTWIDDIATATGIDDNERRFILAIFILSGRMQSKP